ncbi:MAG: CsgG/HfaB family protein [bacterium]
MLHEPKWTRVLAGVVALMLALGLTAAVQAQQARKTIMVVDFEDTVQGWSMTRDVVTSRVVGHLRDDQNLRMIPRDRVRETLREAKLDTSGYPDREDLLKVAKALEADYVLMGQVAAFDQQMSGLAVGFFSVQTQTATVRLRGRILDVAAGQVVASPEVEVKKQQSGGSAWFGDWWTHVSVNNFDSQLIGKATLEAVDQLVVKVKPHLK